MQKEIGLDLNLIKTVSITTDEAQSQLSIKINGTKLIN